MRFISGHAGILVFLVGFGYGLPQCRAQKWEIGGLGGGGFYNSASVSAPSGSGDVGFKSSFAAGALIGNSMYRYIGGELRYEYLPGDLKVSSGGTSATFTGRSQAVHYDF